jgi:hypothetical protein
MQRGRYISTAMMAGALALAGRAGRPAQAALPSTDPKVAVTATNLPAGWTAVPLGIYPDTIAQKQSVSVDSNGVWSISASGKDLWNADDGGLLIYQMHAGDGSVSFHLLGKPAGGQDAAGSDTGWLKDAPAFRESLDSGALDVHIDASSGNGVETAVRNSETTTPVNPGGSGGMGAGWAGLGDATHLPAGHDTAKGIWVGTERIGNNFNMYWSNDGKVWTKAGSTNLPLPDNAIAGIEASAHLDDPTDTVDPPATSKIDNVQIGNQLLAPQSIQNVGYMSMDKSVLVTWDPVGIAAGDVTYNVYQIDPANLNAPLPKPLNATPIKESSFLVPNLTNGTPYLFGVTALVNGVESGVQMPLPNNADRGTIMPSVVPAPPVVAGFTLVTVGTASPGSATLTSGTDLASAVIHMKASGWDMYNESDGFSMLAMPMSGDLDVSARFVKGPTEDADGGGWELGGPIFRETLDGDSRFVMAQIAATNQLQFKRREAQGQTPMNSGVNRDDNTARPVTMRVVRKGDKFQGYYSEDDGKTWKDLGDPTATDASASVDTLAEFSKTPWVGIALCGHTEGEFTEADIDHIVIKAAQ